MFLIRFINKFFIQNLDEKDLARTFERSGTPLFSARVDTPAAYENGGAAANIAVLANGNGLHGHDEDGPVELKSGSPLSTLAAYIYSIVDLLIKSPVGFVVF
jgi:hypothetical protein